MIDACIVVSVAPWWLFVRKWALLLAVNFTIMHVDQEPKRYVALFIYYSSN